MSSQDPKSHYPEEYLDGEVEFFYQKFLVNKHVLIPRLETESLVRKGIEIIKEKNIDTVLDIGTGCGIIPISIALNTEVKNVFATDISSDALKVAQKNCEKLLETNYEWQLFEGDLLEPVKEMPEPVLITANLPYVRDDEGPIMSPDTAHEPDVALFGGGRSGFDTYERFFEQLHKRPIKAIILIEFGLWQRDVAEESLSKYPWKVSFFEDQAGIERFAQIET